MVCSIANAQKKIKGNGKVTTDTRTVSEFDKIGIAGSFDVILVKGNEGEITIEAEENLMEYIVTEVKKGSLKIKHKKGFSLRSTKKMLITVGFNDLNAISLAGSGDVKSKSTIKCNEMKLSLAGSGDIAVAVDAGKVAASIAGSGDIVVSGNADTVNCSIAGSGDVSAFDLSAKTANANIAGSGDISVNASEVVNAKIAGSGNVYYKGDPEKNVKKAGSGEAVKKN